MTKPMAPKHGDSFLGQKGFTLMEVMIAIAILSFILVAVISVTDSSQETALRVVEEDRSVLQVETALSRFEWDVSQAYSPLYFSHAMEPTGLTENEGEVYNQMVDKYTTNSRFAFPSYEALPVPTNTLQEKKTLTFFTTSNRRKFKNSKQSHFAWVRYDLVDPADAPSFGAEEDPLEEKEEQGQVLIRKFLPSDVFSPEEIHWDDIKSQVLLRNVHKLVYEFWNPETKKWTDNLTTIKDGNHRIHALRVNMEWLDTDGFERKFIRVFRPLFPHFEAENMYKLQKEANQAASKAQRTGGDDRDRGEEL